MERNSSARSPASTVVLSIECLNDGSSKSSSDDRWEADLPQTGDIVEEIRIGTLTVKSKFKNGESGVRNILRNSFKQNDRSIVIKVRRGAEIVEVEGHIVKVNQMAWKTRYLLQADKDPNHTVAFVDRTEKKCLELQAEKTSKMKKALHTNRLQEGFQSYPWEETMNQMQSNHSSTAFFSILFLPKSTNTPIQDTVARATTWFNAARAAGTPVLFTSMQTESLLIKISGEAAPTSSIVNVGTMTDLSNVADASVYGFEDIHGVDVGVVRAVRLWFCPDPDAAEVRVEIQIRQNDRKIGFSMDRTPEGFIYISNVVENAACPLPSARAGINNLFSRAEQASKKLVVSRISNQTVLPSMVSPTGAIRCFDTDSLKYKFASHLHTKESLVMHVFLGDTASSQSTYRPGETINGSPSENAPSPGEEDSFERNAHYRYTA